MPATTATALGLRIATARSAKQLTQQQLADRVGVSVSLVRKVEHGLRWPSDSILDALAGQLGHSPEELLEGPGRTDSRVHQAMPALRAVIAAYDLPDDGPVRPLPELVEAVREMVDDRVNSRYAHLAETVPPLLTELFRAVQAAGPNRRQVARLLAAALRSADAAAYKYGHRDLSGRLVELIRWAASIADEPSLTATAAYVRTEVFFATSQLALGLRALREAIDQLPSPNVPALAAAGAALHMRAAVVAGRIRDAESARLHLAEASALGDGLLERLYEGTAVGPASLRIHRLAVAVELADVVAVGEAVAEAARWVPPVDLPAERRSHYYIDLGRAQMILGRPQHALESLQVARRIAPQHVREHGQVRAELATMVRLDRGRNPELLGFARWARVV